MPLYTYQNKKTGETVELIVKFSERDNQVCEITGVELVRAGVELPAQHQEPTFGGIVAGDGSFHAGRNRF